MTYTPTGPRSNGEPDYLDQREFDDASEGSGALVWIIVPALFTLVCAVLILAAPYIADLWPTALIGCEQYPSETTACAQEMTL
ncbi:MAG: hypothetical protein ACK4NW_02135 [Roseinatronobacter sp.]